MAAGPVADAITIEDDTPVLTIDGLTFEQWEQSWVWTLVDDS